MTALSSTATLGEVRQPAEGGPSYIYRGDGIWDLHVVTDTVDLTAYYTKGQIDTALGTRDTNITSAANAAAAAASTANAAIPATQKAAANGVASLDAGGDVPLSQLGNVPAAAVWSVAGKTGAVSLVKGDVGLGNVDNTTDLLKPISTATQAALDAKQPLAANLTSWAAIAPADKLDAASYTAADIKTKLLTVDGAASTIDADLVDGYHAASFVRTINGGGPDGSGNVTVAAGVQDVRLGAESSFGGGSPYVSTASAGHAITQQQWFDGGSGYYVSGMQRPIQKQVSGTWTTVSQI